MQRGNYLVFRGREDKLGEVGRVFSDFLKGDVLDVGCDAKVLSRFAPERYVGVGIGGKPNIVVNAEMSLPFHDRSFDTVVAFDILEHLDHFNFAFDEMCRVSRSYIILGLPNAYEWRFRLLFLLGRKLSGKYGLPEEPPVDRHRWLFGMDEARCFVRQRGERHGFTVAFEAFGYFGYRRFLPRALTVLGKLLAPYGISLLAYHYWAVLRRQAEY